MIISSGLLGNEQSCSQPHRSGLLGTFVGSVNLGLAGAATDGLGFANAPPADGTTNVEHYYWLKIFVFVWMFESVKIMIIEGWIP
jgi:hypothetical protein